MAWLGPHRQIAAWFVIVGVVMLGREACELYGARFIWVEGWLHVGRMPQPPIMRLLAGLALPFAAAFVYVGARLKTLLRASSELPAFIAWLGAGRALVQVLVERSLGYEMSLAPLLGMTLLAWLLDRSVTRAATARLLTRT